jgi:hypothetical protein
VLRPAVNTHHAEEARNKAKARATLSPVKTAAVVGVGVVGLMGLHQVWGKVHDFLFGESKQAPPASITPPLAPAVEVPEAAPVPKVKPQTNKVQEAFRIRDKAGWNAESAVLETIGEAGDKVAKTFINTVAPKLEIDPQIFALIAKALETPAGKGGLLSIISVLYVAYADRIPNIGNLIDTIINGVKNLLPHTDLNQMFSNIIDKLPTTLV